MPADQSYLKPFSPDMPEFQEKAFQALFSHWTSLREKDGIPFATALNPRPLAPWLRSMTIMEVLLPQAVNYRLVGTAVVDRLGLNPTGKNLFELMKPEIRPSVTFLYASLTGVPCGAITSHINLSSDGKMAKILVMHLPLAVPAGEAPRIVAMNLQQEVVDYLPASGHLTIGSALNHHTWIDLGFGVPDESALSSAVA
jgi:hypothetical protein